MDHDSDFFFDLYDLSNWNKDEQGIVELSYLLTRRIDQERDSIVSLLGGLSQHPSIKPLLPEEMFGEELTLQRCLSYIEERIDEVKKLSDVLQTLSLSLRKKGN